MNKEEYMLLALKEAQKAYKKNEVPIGAILVYQDKVISKAHNLREKNRLVTSHAEILAIQKANKKLKSWMLDDCELYVTVEPCPMCAGTIIQSRIKKVYFGAYDPKAGCCSSLMNMFETKGLNHHPEFEGGVLIEECSNILKKFFKEMRVSKEKTR